MAERPRFETRLEDVLARYADSAPTAVDPTTIAHVVVTDAGTTGSLRAWLGSLRVARAGLLLAILVTLLVAVVLATGGWRAPAPDSPVASRLYVSDDHTAWVLGPTGEILASGIPPHHRSGPCGSTLICGTTLLAGRDFGSWAFSSLADEPLPRVGASLNYAGGERWSPDRIKVAMMRFKGTLTVLDFSDPEDVLAPTWSVPGVMDVVWAPDSERLLIARRAGTDAIDIELIRIDEPVGTNLGRVEVPFGTFVWTPDGQSAALVGGGDDETARSPSAPLPVLLNGDITLLGPIDLDAAAWSPAGDRLAGVRDGDLVVADRSGIKTVLRKKRAGDFLPPVWAGEDALIIEQGHRLLTVTLDHAAVTVVDPASSTRAWGIEGSDLLVARPVAGGIDLAWYRGGSGEVLRTRELRGPSEAEGRRDRICLDVVPLPV
jgi:hypothetical protein